jgi:hypothetical protein
MSDVAHGPLVTYMKTSPLPVKGGKIKAYCSALRAFEQAGIFIMPHTPHLTWDLGFSGLLDVSEMWQIERLQLKNHYKFCRMDMSTLDMIIITT